MSKRGAFEALTEAARPARKNGSMASAPRLKTRGGRRRGIERIVEILECLYARGEPLRPNQIASVVGAPRSTVYEIVGQLRQAGLLETFDGEGKVFLGRRLHYLGMAYVKNFDLMREADQALRQLTSRTNQTSQLCMIDGRRHIVALMRLGGPHFRVSSDIGQLLPLPWTASGPLLVSHMSDAEIQRFVPEDDFALPEGERLDPKVFLQKVRRARECGLSRNNAVVDTFTHCMAAPVVNGDGKCVATLCIVVARVEAERRGDELAAALVEVAGELSERIGGGAVTGPPMRQAVGRRSFDGSDLTSRRQRSAVD
jgi:DNA-binding IclR family transcriptional regulator